MTEERTTSNVMRQLWAVAAIVVSAGGLVGLIADLAQIDTWITTGGPAVIRVPAYLIIAGCIVILFKEKLRRSRSAIAAATIGLVCLGLISAASALWPTATSTSEAQSQQSTPHLAPGAPSTPTTTTSHVPVRGLALWAQDVNKICADEATKTGAAFAEIRSAGAKIIELSKQYQINTPADVARHAETLAPPMQQAFTAATTVDNSYTTVLRQMKSVDLPTEADEKAAAKMWVDRYEQLGEKFHTLYETLASYTVNDNDFVRATFFTKFALLDGPAYLDLTPKVFDEGRELGIESCL